MDDDEAEHQPAQRVSLGAIGREWLRLGCIGFGGPPTHIVLLRRLCVEGAEVDRGEGVRGRHRHDEPPSRPGFDAAGDLLRLAPAGGGGPSSAGCASSSRAWCSSCRCRRCSWPATRPIGCWARRPAPGRRCPRWHSTPPGDWPRPAGSAIGAKRAQKVRWVVYALLGGAAAATVGPYLVLVARRPAARRRSSSAARADRCSPGSARAFVPAVVLHGAAVGGLGALALGGVQGRCPLLRRRVRHHPAHAARRRHHVPLDDRRPVPQRRRTWSDHPRSRGADGGRGRLRSRGSGRRIVGGADRLCPLVRLRPWSAVGTSTRSGRTARWSRSSPGPGRRSSAPSPDQPSPSVSRSATSGRSHCWRGARLAFRAEKGVVTALLIAGAIGVVVALSGVPV